MQIMAGWSLGRRPDQAARAEPGSEADELTAELTASHWRAQDHANWPLTVRHNITMGRAADPDALDRAAAASGAPSATCEA